METQRVWLLMLLMVVSPLALASPLDAEDLEDVASEEEVLMRVKRQGRPGPWQQIDFWEDTRVNQRVYDFFVRRHGQDAVTDAGITVLPPGVAQPGMPCCRGFKRKVADASECIHPRGWKSCCAEDKSFLSPLGRIGVVNPSPGETANTCSFCYARYYESCDVDSEQN